MTFLDGWSQTVKFSATALLVFSTTISMRTVPPARTVVASQRLLRSSTALPPGCGLGGTGGGGGEPTASVADAVLFAGFGSAVEELTDPILVTEPPAPPTMRACTVNVASAPDASVAIAQLTVWPLVVQPAPADESVSSGGSVSLTTTLVAASGPLLWAVSVNAMVSPTFALVGPVLVSLRSAAGGVGAGGGVVLEPTGGVALVALLLLEVGSVTPVGGATVAVFEIVPVVPLGTVPESVIVVDAPEARVTAVAMLPVPDVGEQPGAQVHVNAERAAGTVSATAAPDTGDGPAFATEIVYVRGEPAV